MRKQSDAIRGLRWGALAVTIALAAIAVVRLTGQSPAAQAFEDDPTEQALGLVAGPGSLRHLQSGSGPPSVPPPPPLPGSKPRVRVTRTFVAPPPFEPEPMPVAELRAPVILGLDSDRVEPVSQPEATVVALVAAPPAPEPPVIINHAMERRSQHRENAAVRFVKTVGRAIGF